MDYPEAYKKLDVYMGNMYNKYAANGRSYLDKDDLVQEAMIAFFLKKEKGGNREPWAVVLDALRKSYLLKRTSYVKIKDGNVDYLISILKGGIPYHKLYDDSLVNETDPDTKILIGQILDMIGTLKVLPSWNGKKRQLFELFLEGKSQQEIAEEFGVTKQYVSLAKHIIIKALRKKLGCDDEN